jgi:hypothetical protein
MVRPSRKRTTSTAEVSILEGSAPSGAPFFSFGFYGAQRKK